MQDDDFTFSPDTESGPADWNLLAIHHKRGALFVVDSALDLKTVAKALAEDNVQLVKTWMVEMKLRKPKETEVADWEKNPSQQFAQFYIVQPFVIIQISQFS